MKNKKPVIILCILALGMMLGIKTAIVSRVNNLEACVTLNYSEVAPVYAEPDTPMVYDVLKYDLMWDLEKDDNGPVGMESFSNEHMKMLVKKDSYNLPAKKDGKKLTIDCDAERELFREKPKAEWYHTFGELIDELNRAVMRNAIYSYTDSSTLYAFDNGNMKFSIIDTSSGMFNVEVFVPKKNYYISFLIIDKDSDITAKNILDFASRISYKV